ncbi:MAG: zinc ribbon domain-containing protein [Phormidesmis priestleyi]|uniref:Zinc ribbon domain-containing protein n=1 Tax=Phormidesmis priestleyi TaxID=268141 RepID=A0A2W4Z368_9CYAN|nr:MAG: zinc ribbon domain-containing protein [Phormidesmis priestleyi]
MSARSACPRCDRAIAADALNCPDCGFTLKAHGHPGMPLYRAEGTEPLCNTCTYHADNTCNFPNRPQAMSCTLYQNIQTQLEPTRSEIYRIPWWRKNAVPLASAILIAISLLISIF